MVILTLFWLFFAHCESPTKFDLCMPIQGNKFYTLSPITKHFGAFVDGINLTSHFPLSCNLVEQIRQDIQEFRLLVFRSQGLVSGADQVELSRHLGTVESTFYKHPRSPHPEIFRVSNDESEGCTGVGVTGWHVDGTFQPMPFKFQTMHFHSVSEGGDTWFIPLHEFFELQDEATKRRWDKLWMLTGRANYAHPLTYRHPDRGDTAMTLHCGRPFCIGWAVVEHDASAPSVPRVLEVLPPDSVQAELSSKLNAAVLAVGVKLRWQQGDLAICDNLALAHLAPPGTQRPRADAGLRVLHRTTVAAPPGSLPHKDDGRRSFVFPP